jgi:hypothetical protein
VWHQRPQRTGATRRSVLRESNKLPLAEEFQTILIQATVYTTPTEFQSGRALSAILSRWADIFTNILFASDLPSNVPVEIPRVMAESGDGRRRIQVGPNRVDLFAIRTIENIEIYSFLDLCCAVFAHYTEAMRTQVSRMGCVASRLHETDAPAIQLARHFCQDRWWTDRGPLNRPSDLELHAAKQYRLDELYNVNSWIRFRTPLVVSPGQEQPRPSIFVEQDINTRESPGTDEVFSNDEMRDFFHRTWREMGTILALYFPVEDRL